MMIAPSGEMIMKSKMIENCKNASSATTNVWYPENFSRRGFSGIAAASTAPVLRSVVIESSRCARLGTALPQFILKTSLPNEMHGEHLAHVRQLGHFGRPRLVRRIPEARQEAGP